jgi:hypothetical protein
MPYKNRNEKPDRERTCGFCKKLFYPVNGKQECCEECKANGNRTKYFQRKHRGKHLRSPERAYNDYKRGAEIRGYSFTLTNKQFMEFWQKPCYYCGSEIKTIGLDRVYNNAGYTMDNVVPCCWVCNRMKNNINPDAFIDKCIEIANRFI